FDIAISPTELKIARGKNAFFFVNITLLNDISDFFTFDLLYIPQGANFKIISESIDERIVKCIFEVNTTPSVELGVYSIIFVANSLNGNKSVPMLLYITEELSHTFLLDISPKVQSVSGDYAIYTVEAFWLDDTSSSIYLEAYCDALGISINISQKVISNGENTILLLSIAKNVPPGNYTVTVMGTSDGITVTSKAWLILNRTSGNVSFTLSIPKGKNGHPGNNIIYEFVLKNTDSKESSFVAYAYSKNNWNVIILGGNLTKKLMPGEEIVIKVKVTIPRNAKGSDLLIFKIRPSEGSNETFGEVVTKVIIEESNAWLLALLILILIIVLVLVFIILRRTSKKGFVELKTETPELKDADIKSPEPDIHKTVEKKEDKQIETTQPTKETSISPVTLPAIQETQTTTQKSEPIEPISKPTAQVTPPAKVKCKCGNVIEVISNERPLKVKCNVCGKEGILKAKPQEVQNKELSERSVSSEVVTQSLPETEIQKTKEISQKVRCKCGNVIEVTTNERIEVTTNERPLKIKCSVCGKEGMLKSKPSSENTQITSKLDQKESSAELADTSSNIEQPKPVGKVRCSACSEPIFVYTKERPIIVQCPKCGKKGRLK
ncbi:MAG: hypothetical protein QXT63_00395, partial [Thermoplasmata archaeon]